jgi:hypothetical protein
MREAEAGLHPLDAAEGRAAGARKCRSQPEEEER